MMENYEIKKKKRVIITTRDEPSGIGQIQKALNWEVCYYLFANKYDEIKADKPFMEYLSKIEIPNDEEELIKIDTRTSGFINDDGFVSTIINDDMKKNEFLDRVSKSDFVKKHFLQKEEIFILPIINDDYSQDNVKYVEKLVEWLYEDGVDLFLLLHDKDIFNTSEPIKQKRVTPKTKYLSEISLEDEKLKSLIENGKVYAFIHEEDKDAYYKGIVKSINRIDVEKIVEILNDPTISLNQGLFEKLGSNMTKNEIEKVFEAADKKGCDFSKQFLP